VGAVNVHNSYSAMRGASVAGVVDSTGFSRSDGSWSPHSRKLVLVNVIARRLMGEAKRVKMAWSSLDTPKTHLRDGLVGVGRQRKKSALPHPVYPAGPFEDRGAVTYVTADDLAMAPQRWLI